jgi:hypothetical protein
MLIKKIDRVKAVTLYLSERHWRVLNFMQFFLFYSGKVALFCNGET